MSESGKDHYFGVCNTFFRYTHVIFPVTLFSALHKDCDTWMFLMIGLHAHYSPGGTNAGVMKHVGEAVKEQAITFGSEDKVNVIGIATWGIVDRKDALIGKVG